MTSPRSALRAGLMVSLVAACAPAFGAISGDAELLRLVAKGHRANVGRIKSWQGGASVLDSRSGGQVTPRSARSEVEFVYDAQRETSRWNWQVVEAELGGTAQPGDRYRRSVMVTRDMAYELTYPVGQEEKPRRLEALAPEDIRPQIKAHDFDPLLLLTCRGEDIHDLLMWYHGRKDSPAMAGRVDREGNLVTFERELEGGLTRYIFDLSKGCGLVSFFCRDGDVYEEEWIYSYEEQDGTFVPTKVSWRHQMAPDQAGGALTTREVTLSETVLNEDIEGSQFELASLGLRPGDQIHDGLLDVVYTYGDTRYPMSGLDMALPEADEALGATTAAPEPSDRPDPPMASAPPVPTQAGRPGGGFPWLAATIGGIGLVLALWRASALLRRGSRT